MRKYDPEKARRYYLKNRERILAQHRKYRADPVYKARQATYMRTYGRVSGRSFTALPHEYEAFMASQGGVCAICSSPPGRKRFDTDHDHKTGTLRGLLCNRCNTKLGILEDQAWLERAGAYLESTTEAREL